MTASIGHLSVEDLFAPLPEKTRLGGPGPFVINLTVSTAPIDLPPKSFDSGRDAYVYQVQRTEDRRLRYRLRLGAFANEDDADAALKKVRNVYPGALTATADVDDLRAIAALQVKTGSQQSRAVAKAAELASVMKAAAPSMPLAPPVLRDRIVAPPRPAAPKPCVTPPSMAPDLKKRSLSVDSTHTVRALSTLELESNQASQWFVIQLSLSEQAFDSETVPNLDIFSVYRLYSVAGIDQGRIVHALRLGFFAEGSAAAAVASYLSAYYDKPTVKRVSSAERERFVDQRFEPRKDVGATGKHAVIEITNVRYVREKRNTNI